jgi:hypothetical protein
MIDMEKFGGHEVKAEQGHEQSALSMLSSVRPYMACVYI